MSSRVAHSGRMRISAPLMLAASLLGCSRQGDGQPENDTPRSIIVRTVPAEVHTIEETVEGIGRTEALPNRLATLTPALEGQVEQILVNLGDSVRQGDPIVQLDATLAQADVNEKKANRDTQLAALALLEAEPRPEDRRGPEIAVEQAKAAVQRANAAVDRLRPLRARNEVSAAQLFDVEQALVQAGLAQEANEAQLTLLIVGPRPQAVAEAQARMAAAQEALALSQARYDLHRIRAPIDGVVDSLTCHPGQTIAAGTSIGEVVDVSQAFVTVWLTATSAAKVKPGQAARIWLGDTAPAGPVTAVAAGATGDDPVTAAGKVFSIGRVVDSATGNIPIRILVANLGASLALGETVAVTIVEREHTDVLVVPSNSLVDLGEGQLLNVVRGGKIVQIHPASVAPHGRWTAVSGTNLRAGEQVVVDGGFNLPEETEVQVESLAYPVTTETGR